MPPTTSLRDIERAVRGAWGADVCEDPADVPRWSPANPSRGQCGPTALVLNDLLGGDLCVAEVRLPDGSRQGFHCPPKRGEQQYRLLRARVLAALGATS